jgi:hypothetical protein
MHDLQIEYRTVTGASSRAQLYIYQLGYISGEMAPVIMLLGRLASTAEQVPILS